MIPGKKSYLEEFTNWSLRKEVVFSKYAVSPYDASYTSFKAGLLVFYAGTAAQAISKEGKLSPERVTTAGLAIARFFGAVAEWIDYAVEAGWTVMKKAWHIALKVFGHMSAICWYSWSAFVTLREIIQIEKGEKLGARDVCFLRLQKWSTFFSHFFLGLQSIMDASQFVHAVSLTTAINISFWLGIAFFVASVYFYCEKEFGGACKTGISI